MLPSEADGFSVAVQQSKHASHRNTLGELVLEVRLPYEFLSSQSYSARLIHVGGLARKDEPVFVFASFVEPQPFNSGYRALLGVSEPNSPPVRILGNCIPATFTLTLAGVSGRPLTGEKRLYSLLFHVFPTSPAV